MAYIRMIGTLREGMKKPVKAPKGPVKFGEWTADLPLVSGGYYHVPADLAKDLEGAEMAIILADTDAEDTQEPEAETKTKKAEKKASK